MEQDTLPEWLYWRFGAKSADRWEWEALEEEDREYWAHEAAAVRRAVERGGFREPR